jgi:hypothetical protein
MNEASQAHIQARMLLAPPLFLVYLPLLSESRQMRACGKPKLVLQWRTLNAKIPLLKTWLTRNVLQKVQGEDASYEKDVS